MEDKISIPSCIHLDTKTWYNPEITKILKQIDWKTLDECISFTNPGEQIYIQMRVLGGGLSGGMSRYKYADTGKFADNKSRVIFHSVRSEDNTPEQILTILCHEMAHAYCKKNGTYSGYGENSFLELLKIDEGVTELVAEEIFLEYIKRTGERQIFGNVYQFNPKYKLHVRHAKELIKIISREAGISYDVAWKAIRTSYFQGESLIDILMSQNYGINMPIECVRKITMNAGLFDEIRFLIWRVLRSSK